MTDPKVPHLLDPDAPAGEGSDLLRAALRGARRDVPGPAHVDTLAKALATAIGTRPPGGGGGDGGSGSGSGSGSGAGPGAGSGAGPGAGAGAGSGMSGAIGGTKLAIGAIATAAAIGGVVFATRTPANDASTSASASATASASAPASASASASAPASASASASASAAVFDVHALPTASVPVKGVATGSPEQEMSLLEGARKSLAGSPADALAKCDEHARTYPGGGLSEEREVIAVDALVRLGRRGEAEKRADRFKAAHPASAYVRRMDSLLGR